MMDTDKIKYVVIGGSAGSFRVITAMLAALPDDFPLPVILCLHRLKHVRSGFTEALEIKSKIPVIEPYDKMHIKAGKIYLAPANYHLFVELGNHFSLGTMANINHSRPSIDLTFESAAMVFRQKMVGILLSGANKDGAQGLYKVKQNGGFTIVQDPLTAQASTMPEATIKLFKPDLVLSPDRIFHFLKKLNHAKNKHL